MKSVRLLVLVTFCSMLLPQSLSVAAQSGEEDDVWGLELVGINTDGDLSEFDYLQTNWDPQWEKSAQFRLDTTREVSKWFADRAYEDQRIGKIDQSLTRPADEKIRPLVYRLITEYYNRNDGKKIGWHPRYVRKAFFGDSLEHINEDLRSGARTFVATLARLEKDLEAEVSGGVSRSAMDENARLREQIAQLSASPDSAVPPECGPVSGPVSDGYPVTMTAEQIDEELDKISDAIKDARATKPTESDEAQDAADELQTQRDLLVKIAVRVGKSKSFKKFAAKIKQLHKNTIGGVSALCSRLMTSIGKASDVADIEDAADTCSTMVSETKDFYKDNKSIKGIELDEEKLVATMSSDVLRSYRMASEKAATAERDDEVRESLGKVVTTITEDFEGSVPDDLSDRAFNTVYMASIEKTKREGDGSEEAKLDRIDRIAKQAKEQLPDVSRKLVNLIPVFTGLERLKETREETLYAAQEGSGQVPTAGVRADGSIFYTPNHNAPFAWGVSELQGRYSGLLSSVCGGYRTSVKNKRYWGGVINTTSVKTKYHEPNNTACGLIQRKYTETMEQIQHAAQMRDGQIDQANQNLIAMSPEDRKKQYAPTPAGITNGTYRAPGSSSGLFSTPLMNPWTAPSSPGYEDSALVNGLEQIFQTD